MLRRLLTRGLPVSSPSASLAPSAKEHLLRARLRLSRHLEGSRRDPPEGGDLLHSRG